MDTLELNKILRYIEENLRVTDQTTIEYVDPRGHLERLNSKQNQIIFGRRGSGKSLLLKSIREKNKDAISLATNIEDFKDISFPDSIIQVLKAILKQLKLEVNKNYECYELGKLHKARRLKKKLNQILKKLEKRLENPDNYDEDIITKKEQKKAGKLKANYIQSNASFTSDYTDVIEVSKSLKIDKLNILKNELPDLKELINVISEFLQKPIFLILDDFYFIRRSDQPFFIDFFHRLSKNTHLYLKVATIKHRTSLYLHDQTYVGIEIRHDAQTLNLDYSLENYEALQSFLKDLLNHVKGSANSKIDIENILTDNALRFLCLASGGVPRDFFSLFIRIGNSLIEGKTSITKPDVIEIAIEEHPYKIEAFQTDSADEKDILGHYLQYIKEEIIEKKRTNSFLVSNSDIVKFSQINQAIKELVDLRLLHLVNSNTSSAASDGRRYAAYMLDIGLYPNSRPRNFRQIEPGEKDEEGREDKIRSAPKLILKNFEGYIDNLKLDKQLTETE